MLAGTRSVAARCPLRLAAPVAIVFGLSRASRIGVIITSASAVLIGVFAAVVGLRLVLRGER